MSASVNSPEKIKVFRVVQCPSCGHVQSTQSMSTFKCHSCGASKTMNPKSKYGLGVKVLGSFGTGAAAAKFVQAYRAEKAKSKGKDSTDFVSF